MGRFHIGGFDRPEIDTIISTFRDATTVICYEKREPQDGGTECKLIFHSTKFGKIMLQLLPDSKWVVVHISHDVQNPSGNTSHSILMDNCVKVHHHRSDARVSILSVIFENENGKHLQITEEGQIYFGQILTWKELGDQFPTPSKEV